MRLAVLILAREPELRAAVARAVHAAGYPVELAESARRAREVAAEGRLGSAGRPGRDHRSDDRRALY